MLLKDTALGFLVTYDELLKQLKQLATAPDFAFPLIPLTLVGGSIYIATCLLLAFLANRLEARTRRSVKVAPGAVVDARRTRPAPPPKVAARWVVAPHRSAVCSRSYGKRARTRPRVRALLPVVPIMPPVTKPAGPATSPITAPAQTEYFPDANDW
ncbi:hypothetical protein [Fodinicola feengrottensis]|uniref:hypothetical protein n=1 Tax=Fodinicola feengrottensis TaxID=435914 RepID=UPI002442D8D4|nr:hypothetical protein [Fodinicola feengrottensis]